MRKYATNVIELLAKNDANWRKMALHICKDKDLADELVQEMYLKSHTFKSDSPNYIFFVLKNLHYDYKKSNVVCIDDFSNFDIQEVESHEPEDINYDEAVKSLTWYEKTIFEQSILLGQRKLSRATGIHIQTIHRVNKTVKEKVRCQLKNQNSEQSLKK